MSMVWKYYDILSLLGEIAKLTYWEWLMLEPLVLNERKIKSTPAGFSTPLALAYGNACVLDSGVYFFGRDSSSVYSKIYRLNGSKFTAVTTIPRARFGMRIVGYGENLFVFGTGTSAEDRVLQKYNITSGTWSNHLAYHKDFIWSSVCQDGQYAYLTSKGIGRNDNEVTRLDLAENTVKIDNFPVTNVDRAHMFIVARGDDVYFGGGFTDVTAFRTFSDVYCLNLTTGIQRRLPDMPEVGYFAMNYGILRNKLILVNPLSGTNATATATHSKKVLSLNLDTEKWRYELDALPPLSHTACFTVDSTFYRLGGRNQTTFSSDCLMFK